MEDKPAREDVVNAFRSDRLLKLGLITVIASTLFFGFGGGLVGWLLGLLAPDYYRVTVDLGPNTDATQVGLGLGVTQGAFAGVIVGCVVLLSTAWYKSRIQKAVLNQIEDE